MTSTDLSTLLRRRARQMFALEVGRRRPWKAGGGDAGVCAAYQAAWNAAVDAAALDLGLGHDLEMIRVVYLEPTAPDHPERSE